jgi:hypothetical protein
MEAILSSETLVSTGLITKKITVQVGFMLLFY